jgi:hypothetical protein
MKNKKVISQVSQAVGASKTGALSTTIKTPAENSAPTTGKTALENHERANGRSVLTVMIYHVTDKHGRHRFLTMNDQAANKIGGVESFEGILASQFQTVELLGTNPVAIDEKNPSEVLLLDPDGAAQLRNRIKRMMAAHLNSSHYLEPWLPKEEDRVQPITSDINKVPWRPMSTFKKDLGDPQDIIIQFRDVDACDVVKPEFVSAANARGGALLRELKDDVRAVLEPQLTPRKQ